ncbi:hypothetical protein C8R47DRAFT_1204133 [Mycena vitilis]|nr:hypothetical protein C8R47DRAFT_1204133 [Mycena vitilis]
MSSLPVPDDPNRCLAREPDGSQCICKRAPKTVVEGNRILCVNCGHIETAHPEAPAPALAGTALFKKFQDAGRLRTIQKNPASSSSAMATEKEAQSETNKGLLAKRKKSSTDTEPAPSKKPKATPNPRDSGKSEGQWVKIDQIVVLPCGTLLTPGSQGGQGSRTLRRTKAPKADEITNILVFNNLGVQSTPDRQLRINTLWSTSRCDKYFASVLPELFGYLENHPPSYRISDPPEIQQQRWLVVIKTNQSVALASSELPTGSDLARHCKKKGHGSGDRILFLGQHIHIISSFSPHAPAAAKKKIPSSRYTDWSVASESEDIEEEEDFDMLDNDTGSSPAKPAASKSKGKAKAKAIAKEEEEEFEGMGDEDSSNGTSMSLPLPVHDFINRNAPVNESKSGVILETGPTLTVKSEETEPLPDMKAAAKMRTRLATGAITWNSDIIPASVDEPIIVSDDEMELPKISNLPSSLPLSAPSTAPGLSSAVASSWTAPLFTSFADTTASPEPDPFEDSDFNSGPHSPGEQFSTNPSAWTSTSSLASSSGYMPAPSPSATASSSSLALPLPPVSVSTPSPSTTMPTSSNPSNGGGPGLSSQPSGFIRKSGKARVLSNPWM